VFQEIGMMCAVGPKERARRADAVVTEDSFLGRRAEQRLCEPAREEFLADAHGTGEEVRVRERLARKRIEIAFGALRSYDVEMEFHASSKRRSRASVPSSTR